MTTRTGMTPVEWTDRVSHEPESVAVLLRVPGAAGGEWIDQSARQMEWLEGTRVYRLNAEENRELADHLGVRRFPALVAYYGGSEVFRLAPSGPAGRGDAA